MLRREQKIRNIILFTLFSLVFIGVGYAVISSNLQMNGSMTLNKITWDVHFENFEELYDNTVAGTKTLTNNNTTLTYNVNLNKPGDVFEFTIDVVNNGNIDAMLSNIGENGLTSAQQQVMDYNVTYLDGTTPTVKDSLKIGEIETFVVSVKTKLNITNSQLAATDTNLTLTFNPTYAQDDGTSTLRNQTLSTKIITLNGGKAAIIAKGEPARQTAETGVVGMYSLPDDYGDSFFYRGKVDDNNIIYNNMCWKIIRINGNGTIRVIYNGTPSNGECTATEAQATIGSTKYSDNGSYNAYVGYMHGNITATTYEETHSNVYDSKLKQTIDSWYSTNFINGIDKYVSDTYFCNDRTIESTTETGVGNSVVTFYGARYRYDYTTPILTCSQQNDRFTVNDTTTGNGDLKYPVALITGDEAMLAGIRYGTTNTDVYLYSGSGYYTMSPISNLSSNDTTNTSVWLVSSGGFLNFGNVSIASAVRPVINLKQGTKIVSGAGTTSDPYIVSIGSNPTTRIKSLNTEGTTISTKDHDNELRFIGSNPNNYVNFNNQKWRIIGVFNGQLKIIQESIGSYSWDSSKHNINNGYGINQWGSSTYSNNEIYAGSDLMKLLNPGYEENTDYLCNSTITTNESDQRICGDGTDENYTTGIVNNSLYWNSSSGTCYKDGDYGKKNCDFTSTGLSDETSKNMIENHLWKVGSNDMPNANLWNGADVLLTSSKFYEWERSSNSSKQCTQNSTYCSDLVNRTTEWRGKVGLMYPSDWIYATGGGTLGRNSCLSKIAGYLNVQDKENWANTYTTCYEDNWLNINANQWTITSRATNAFARTVFHVTQNGYVHNTQARNSGVVRPVVYLKRNVTFSSTGDGSYENPFNLILN